ncbi:MAG TPA: radical SAM protein [Gemmatimonadales bacterium]|jgi:magnesium-protoporphyrin IX monomethyl ester (oxidative) cyclase|nr:radical SAM protein [Gemmatimonadales bacterium]
MVEPLGLECLGAAVKLHGHEVALLDLRLDRPSALPSALKSPKPGAVGISCGFTTDVYTTLWTARAVKDTIPGIPVFVGGHHASLVPGDFLFPGSPVDAVVIGEGEWTAAELADALERGDDPASIAGVLTLENRNGGFKQRVHSNNLDELPLPDRRLTLRYRRRYHHAFDTPSACVETSRGCPFDCNFCSIWVFYQRRARRRSPERIVEDLEQVRALGEDRVFFTDDIAFLQHDAYEQLALKIKEAGLKHHYSCETRADLIVRYRDLFPLWKEVGLKTVFLGIEKVDDVGLDSIRKRTKGGATTNLEAIEILRGNGITPMTSLITDPAWGEEDFDRLEQYLSLLHLPCPTFTILTPLPGTELWESRKHELVTDDYTLFDVMHLVLPSKLPPERFYQRFAGLYGRVDANARLTWPAVRNLTRLVLQGKSFAVRRVLQAARELRNAKAFLAHPGSLPRPEFVPEGFGRPTWVDRSRSHLAQRVASAV